MRPAGAGERTCGGGAKRPMCVKGTATADSAEDTDSVSQPPVVAEPIATGAPFDRTPRTGRNTHLKGRSFLNRRWIPGATQFLSAFISVHQRLNCCWLGANGTASPASTTGAACRRIGRQALPQDEKKWQGGLAATLPASDPASSGPWPCAGPGSPDRGAGRFGGPGGPPHDPSPTPGIPWRWRSSFRARPRVCGAPCRSTRAARR
jgi:hypothetical protein